MLGLLTQQMEILLLSLETVKKKISSSYKIVFEEDFVVPFIKEKILEDFGRLL